MQHCVRCGKQLEEFDMGGDMVCMDCESSRSHGGSSGTDVPCQRCGMYLPSHELQMWNSRLYCQYCIMDIKDEEERMKKHHGHSAPERGGSILDIFGGGPGRGGLPLASDRVQGACERCGKQAGMLYEVKGRRLCPQCAHNAGSDGSAEGARPGRQAVLLQIREFAARALPFWKKPRAVAKEEGAPQHDVFDLHRRKMVGKKHGMHSQHPISERAHREKKLDFKLRKTDKGFYALHPAKPERKKP